MLLSYGPPLVFLETHGFFYCASGVLDLTTTAKQLRKCRENSSGIYKRWPRNDISNAICDFFQRNPKEKRVRLWAAFDHRENATRVWSETQVSEVEHVIRQVSAVCFLWVTTSTHAQCVEFVLDIQIPRYFQCSSTLFPSTSPLVFMCDCRGLSVCQAFIETFLLFFLPLFQHFCSWMSLFCVLFCSFFLYQKLFFANDVFSMDFIPFCAF